jgi:hypothetical protein
VLPVALALSQGTPLTVVDYLPLHQDATADATGQAVVSWEAVELGYLWLMDAGSVRSNSTGDVQATLWAGPRLMDGSDGGSFDFSDRNSPVLVAAGESLQIVWTGCVPGAICTFDGQYQLVLKGSA